MVASQRMSRWVVAAIAVLLVAPGALFMGALVGRQLQPEGREPAETAGGDRSRPDRLNARRSEACRPRPYF